MTMPDHTPEELKGMTMAKLIQEMNKLLAEMAARTLPPAQRDADGSSNPLSGN
jgi:hypothetical protein